MSACCSVAKSHISVNNATSLASRCFRWVDCDDFRSNVLTALKEGISVLREHIRRHTHKVPASYDAGTLLSGRGALFSSRHAKEHRRCGKNEIAEPNHELSRGPAIVGLLHQEAAGAKHIRTER
jgi:hypothetical protein